MKRLLIILAALFISQAAFSQPEDIHLNIIWEEANNAYRENDFEKAVTLYDSLYRAGYSSHRLYYNMGNAYFKQNAVGKSVLFYNRALLLKPSDADTKYNLEIANGFIKDNIEVVPDFFFTRWVRGLSHLLSSNMWAVASLVFLALAFAGILVYILAEKLSARKAGFYVGLIGICVVVLSVVFAISERNDILFSDQAIVMISAAPVKSSPDARSKDIFVIHEGTKLTVTGTLGQWREIELADGHKGWIDGNSIESLR